MKKILVPCDFSKPAINAYRFALDVAAKSKSAIYMINVIELPILHDSVLMPVLSFEEELLKELAEKVVVNFKKLTSKYSHKGIKVISKVEFGSPAKMITDFAGKNAIDLIVMGSHGASGLKEYFIGSNAEKAVRHSKSPVLVVKNYNKSPIRNIVFPNTLETENQGDLIGEVKALQNFFKAKLHVVFINTPTNFTSDTVTLDRLHTFAKTFKLKNYSLNIYNHSIEDDGIIHFTRHIKGNLIAMGTRGRSGLSHFISGSVAEDVVNRTDYPIWTYSGKKGT